MLRWVKIRVRPDSRQLCISNIISIAGFFDVDRIANRRQFTGLFINLAFIGPYHVVDLLPGMTVLVPALDDLDTVEVTAFGIF